MSRSEYALILNVLRKTLKSRKMTYRALAKKLDLSESTIKKTFSDADCSFNRLSKICEVLGLRLYDVLESIENKEIKTARFSMKQEQWFVENLDCFFFYWQLLVERQSTEEIGKQFGLSDRQVFKYLKALDDLNLIELHSGNRVKLPKFSIIKWSGSGPLTQTIFQDWSEKLASEAFNKKDEEGFTFELRYLKLKKSSRLELQKAVADLIAEFSRRSNREYQLDPGALESVRALMALAPGGFVREI